MIFNFKLAEKRAMQGDSLSMFEIAQCYNAGVYTEQNDFLYIYWLKKFFASGKVKDFLLKRNLSRLFSPAEYKCPTLLRIAVDIINTEPQRRQLFWGQAQNTFSHILFLPL